MKKLGFAVLIMLIAGLIGATGVFADPGTITETSGGMNYNGSGGWAGHSCPVDHPFIVSGKVIDADGFDVVMKNSLAWKPGASVGMSIFPTTPFNYSYGTGEQGWIAQDNGVGGVLTSPVPYYIVMQCSDTEPVPPVPPVCKSEKVFYWTDGWCSIRQVGGPIAGQGRPFRPMQNAYCGCDYAHDDGWVGLYAVSDCKGEHSEGIRWNAIPQFCGAGVCEF